MSASKTQLLSSGKFCKMRCDNVPVKSASANVSFYTNNSRNAKFFICDTLVANERCVYKHKEVFHVRLTDFTL
jgi:hypothetical protein